MASCIFREREVLLSNFGIAKRGCDPILQKERHPLSLSTLYEYEISLSLLFFLFGGSFLLLYVLAGRGGEGVCHVCVFWGSIKSSFHSDLSWGLIKMGFFFCLLKFKNVCLCLVVC